MTNPTIPLPFIQQNLCKTKLCRHLASLSINKSTAQVVVIKILTIESYHINYTYIYIHVIKVIRKAYISVLTGRFNKKSKSVWQVAFGFVAVSTWLAT